MCKRESLGVIGAYHVWFIWIKLKRNYMLRTPGFTFAKWLHLKVLKDDFFQYLVPDTK